MHIHEQGALADVPALGLSGRSDRAVSGRSGADATNLSADVVRFVMTNRQPHEQCDECGFDWDEARASELVPRLDAVASRLRIVMLSTHPQLSVRPEPEVWSPVEYGAHIRDVMLNLRERLVVGVAEDNPTTKPMYGAVRLASGLYAHDTPERLADEIQLACDLMGRTITTFMADLERPIFYPWPRPATRTLRWVAAQALHEAEHHLGDIERQLDVDRSS